MLYEDSPHLALFEVVGERDGVKVITKFAAGFAEEVLDFIKNSKLGYSWSPVSIRSLGTVNLTTKEKACR